LKCHNCFNNVQLPNDLPAEYIEHISAVRVERGSVNHIHQRYHGVPAAPVQFIDAFCATRKTL